MADEKLYADMSQQDAFNMVSRSKATPSSKTRLDHLIEGIIRDVCELPDYNSPDDQPELLQATCSQLEAILRNRLGDETFELRIVPTAWVRGVKDADTANGPGEWNADFVYGDDPPDGDGWVPLYSKPPHIRPAVEPFCNQAAATSSGVVDVAPMPRGSLPNSLGTGGAGSHPAASSSEKASCEYGCLLNDDDTPMSVDPRCPRHGTDEDPSAHGQQPISAK